MIVKNIKNTINFQLLKLLRSPDDFSPLSLSEESDAYLTSQIFGNKYSIDESIPIFVKPNKSPSDFDYVEHYQKDAEEFDYFEERKGGTLEEEKRVHEFIRSQIPKSSDSILDVGCGRAWVAEYFAQTNKFVCSMDISLVNVQKALNLYPFENHVGVVADVYHLPFAENSFDIIIASEIIEHVMNPEGLVNSLIRCLKPSGRLIISTPYKEKLTYSLCIHCNQKTPHNAHIHSFDENKLESFTEKKNVDFSFFTFGNKALILLRTHVLLKYLPFTLWKAIDKFANLLINKPAHIVVVYKKDE